MNRAYALLHVKSVDDERRILRGMATTPTPDRLGDIVEPHGVQFKNPMPLLWQHKHDKPVGWATFDKATDDGIAFEAKLPRLEEAGVLRDRIEEAWQSVKLGLVRGVSIGFKALEYSFIDKTDGIRFTETEVMELSLVTIPANSEATIQQIKSLDAPLLAATGNDVTDARPKKPSGAADKPTRKVKAMRRTTAEQIGAWEAKRAANVARMEELMAKSEETGETLDEAANEEYETLEAETKKIDAHLVKLRDHEARQKANAKSAGEENKPDNGRAVIGHNSGARAIVLSPQVEKGTAFIRYVQAQCVGRGSRLEAANFAKNAPGWADTTPEVAMVLEHDIPALMKAAVAAGTTTGTTWAAPLVTYQVMVSEFIELLRPATIIGRIPNLRRVPFNIQMPRTTSGTSVGWVGEGAPKPVSAMAFDTVTMRWAKAAGIVVLTDELIRFSSPAAESVVRSDLIAAMAQFLDRQFVDPTVAAVSNVSPASITNGVTAQVPSGTNAAAFQADAATLFSGVLSNNLNASTGFWIMTQQQALRLSMMVTTLNQRIFPDITPQGGTLYGYPVIASENVPAAGGSPADGYPIIFGLAGEIMLADDGQTVIDASNQASLQMDSAPDNPATASTVLQSLWQNNMTALRAERWINWLKRRSTAVSYIQGAKYA